MKTMKRFGCLLLVLAMVLALGVSGFAASGSIGSITINGAAEGETYSIYKLFDLTYSEYNDDSYVGNYSYSYKVVEAWKDFLSSYPNGAQSYFTIDGNGYLDPNSLVFNMLDDSDFMVTFAQEALSYAVANEIEAAGSDFASDDNGTVLFSDLDLGWYLVDSSIGTLCMLTSTDPDAVINEKNGEPTISKYVEDLSYDDSFVESDEADNNDTLEYALVIENIANVSNLVIHDYLDEQLDVETVDKMTVTLHSSSTDTTGTTLVKDEDYSYTVTGEDKCTFAGESLGMDGCSFEVAIISDSTLSGLAPTAYLVITYEVTISEDAGHFEDLVDEIDNYANVSYGNVSCATAVEAETYSFGFDIYKFTDVTEFDGYGWHKITVEIYNDNPNSGMTQDEFYLCLLDENNGVLYYGVFSEDTSEEYTDTYVVNAWIPANEVEFTQGAGQSVTGTYTDANNQKQTLPYILEPEGSADNPNNTTVTFYYEGIMPDHTAVVLDELGNVVEESDEGAEDEAAEFFPADVTVGLADAEFTLQNSKGQYAWFLYNEDYDVWMFQGWYTLAEGTDLSDGLLGDDYPKGATFYLVSAEDGSIEVEGLHDGTFTLTEAKAPDGYNLLADSVTVTISATGGVLVGSGEDAVQATDKVIEVKNNAGNILPGTGGIGTTIFYVIGAILVCGAVVLLVTKRRTSNKDQAEA